MFAWKFPKCKWGMAGWMNGKVGEMYSRLSRDVIWGLCEYSFRPFSPRVWSLPSMLIIVLITLVGNSGVFWLSPSSSSESFFLSNYFHNQYSRIKLFFYNMLNMRFVVLVCVCSINSWQSDKPFVDPSQNTTSKWI